MWRLKILFDFEIKNIFVLSVFFNKTNVGVGLVGFTETGTISFMKSCFPDCISATDITGWERLIRSHSSARFCFELSGNSN